MTGMVPLFASDDVDAMQELLNGYLEPGSVRLHTPPRSGGELRLSLIAGATEPGSPSGISLHHMEIDRDVEMNAVELPHAYTILIQLSGRNDLALDNEPVPSHHMLCSPGTHVYSRFIGTSQWVVRIGQSIIDEAVSARMADAPGRRLRFDPTLRPDQADVAAWIRLVRAFGDRSMSGLLAGSPLAARNFEQMLVHGLLDIQPHTFTSVFEHDHGALSTPALRRALDFCEQYVDRPITVADMAAAAHTSVRTLQRTFRTEIGMSPLDYLRGVRMRRVRTDLEQIRDGHTDQTIGEVALRWGFTHFGRFSQSYRELYGESPSVTVASRATV